jgi:hypothetical protein
MRTVWVFIVVGLALAAGVKLASVSEDRLGVTAPLLMAAALAALVAGSAALFWHRRFVYGAAVLVVAAFGIQLSLMPWYGKHRAPTRTGWQTHRQTLWELGHDH